MSNSNKRLMVLGSGSNHRHLIQALCESIARMEPEYLKVSDSTIDRCFVGARKIRGIKKHN